MHCIIVCAQFLHKLHACKAFAGRMCYITACEPNAVYWLVVQEI